MKTGFKATLLALLTQSSLQLSMRNVNGECIAQFCWNGQAIDPFDCWCPDPDTTVNTGTGNGGTLTENPVCLQQFCWDDSTPNPIDCSCPDRPKKPTRDRANPNLDASRPRPIKVEFNVKMMAKNQFPLLQYMLLILTAYWYQGFLMANPSFVQNLKGEKPLFWDESRLAAKYWWLTLFGALVLQIFLPFDWFRWLSKWFYTLAMPVVLLGQVALDGYIAFLIRPKVYRYSTMRQVVYSTLVLDFLLNMYSFHLRAYISNVGQYKYWDTQHKLDPRTKDQLIRKVPDEALFEEDLQNSDETDNKFTHSRLQHTHNMSSWFAF